jgi:hypothetical protein
VAARPYWDVRCPLYHVMCNSCHSWTITENAVDPDGELNCPCCPIDHSHAGLGCRTITITALPGSANLLAAS